MAGGVVAAILSGGAWLGLGEERREQAQDTVDSISEKVQSASTTVHDQYVAARTSARNLGLQQQIDSRLRSDKSIDANKIEVLVEDESIAILEGMVSDREAKEKAVELTRDTRGVQQVVDHLAVPPPPRVIAAPASGAAAPTLAPH